MGKALYRKYRSKRLAEIVGQKHITTVLDRALQHGKISHAYLFTGPRGVGKTSIARILAHEVNELPYEDDSSVHLDIIEIDAASNRRIDDIRELRDKVHVAPSRAKYKVYIIDEVHMLTGESFNALLKTLEEPPSHVIFILATTEMHKLPDTIVSRTQHFAFKSVPTDQVVSHLKAIAKEENISIDDEAARLIAEHGGGSFRDSISLLDQVRNYEDTITADTVRALVGAAPDNIIYQLIQSVADHNAQQVVRLLTELQDQGIEAPAIARQLSQVLQLDMLSDKPLLGAQKSVALVRELVEITASQNPVVALKLAMLQATFEPVIAPHVAHVADRAHSRASIQQPVVNQPTSSSRVTHTSAAKKSASDKVKANMKSPQGKAPTQDNLEISTIEPSGDGTVTQDQWAEILLNIKQQYNTLYGVLRMAQTESEPGLLKLYLQFPFHQKRLNDPKNKQIVASAVESHTGSRMAIECLVATDRPVNEQDGEMSKPSTSNSPETLSTISNIFGGGELLES